MVKKPLEKGRKIFYNFLENVIDGFFLFQYILLSQMNKRQAKT